MVVPQGLRRGVEKPGDAVEPTGAGFVVFFQPRVPGLPYLQVNGHELLADASIAAVPFDVLGEGHS